MLIQPTQTTVRLISGVISNDTTMKKKLLNNLIVALSYLLFWVIFDIIDVKFYRFEGFEHELIFALIIIFISFLIVNKNLFSTLTLFLRGLIIVAISIGLTTIWFMISTIIILSFHLAIGGNL
jgi:hypothetical protein